MPRFDNPLVRRCTRQAAWVGGTALGLLCLPSAGVTLYGTTWPVAVPAGAVALTALYPALSCFCTHVLRQHVLLLDAHLKERFDQDARDATCLFEQRRQDARHRLRRFSGELVRTAKTIGDIRDRIVTAAVLCLVLAGAGIWLLVSQHSLNGAAAALVFGEAAVLLLRCERRIGREFAQPGPTEVDQTKLDHDIEAYDRLERELVWGARQARTG